ncbi:NAD(P)-binding protein [Glonium stellatum]|uniref:NAD(P)-binding protein n=1 Tax=Glonium stellatum TaxID=574774 RepID=A0A8E2ETS5_9PEZI|nr:NAD(P)-binding protein [Glonium stellatum]
MGTAFSQFFPPSPDLTERNLPSQKGKVFIVTGGASGVGFELATILFHAGGKVYIAGRSESNAQQSIDKIKSGTHDISSVGELEHLHLELDDLSTIKSSAETFMKKEPKLDVLWNNAGVSMAPIGSKSAQGHELHIATNCLGPFLFTQLLLPTLKAAAHDAPPASVRVVWTSSQTLDAPPADKTKLYVASKAGNWFLGSEMARAPAPHGILSVTQNPGNLKTNLLRHAPWMKYVSYPLLYQPKFGAYTELWAGLAQDLTVEGNGSYVIPWGRIHSAPRKDLLDALKSVEEGGTGRAREFWEWCEKLTAEYK